MWSTPSERSSPFRTWRGACNQPKSVIAWALRAQERSAEPSGDGPELRPWNIGSAAHAKWREPAARLLAGLHVLRGDLGPDIVRLRDGFDEGACLLVTEELPAEPRDG